MAVLKNARHEKFAQGRSADDRRFYVYELVDPRDGSIFYVGKGCGNRDRSHIGEARRGEFKNPAKIERIRLIEAEGQQVSIQRIAIALTEAEAFKIEREQIAKYGLLNLTNIMRGQQTEIDRWIAIANDAQNQIGYRLRSWFLGTPFTRDQVKMAFDCIRCLRVSIAGLEAERAGIVSKIDEK